MDAMRLDLAALLYCNTPRTASQAVSVQFTVSSAASTEAMSKHVSAENVRSFSIQWVAVSSRRFRLINSVGQGILPTRQTCFGSDAARSSAVPNYKLGLRVASTVDVEPEVTNADN